METPAHLPLLLGQLTGFTCQGWVGIPVGPELAGTGAHVKTSQRERGVGLSLVTFPGDAAIRIIPSLIDSIIQQLFIECD